MYSITIQVNNSDCQHTSALSRNRKFQIISRFHLYPPFTAFQSSQRSGMKVRLASHVKSELGHSPSRNWILCILADESWEDIMWN